MSGLKIGVAQVRHSTDIGMNTQRALQIIDRFSRVGADLVLFPECYLSGFSPKLRSFDAGYARKSCELIERACSWYGISCFLPSALQEGAALFNGGYWITPGNSIVPFYKQSLMMGEERLFSARANSKRYFELKGFKVGFLICKEASDPAWSLLQEEDRPDLLLWPGVWGWDVPGWGDHLEKLSADVYRNQKSWRLPLIQANYAGYQPGDTRKPPDGLSVIVDAENVLSFTAPKAAEASFLARLHRDDDEVRIVGVGLVEVYG